MKPFDTCNLLTVRPLVEAGGSFIIPPLSEYGEGGSSSPLLYFICLISLLIASPLPLFSHSLHPAPCISDGANYLVLYITISALWQVEELKGEGRTPSEGDTYGGGKMEVGVRWGWRVVKIEGLTWGGGRFLSHLSEVRECSLNHNVLNHTS